AGVDGIRVQVSGRLGGAEIARTERVGPEGSVPLHTLRADVEKGFAEAKTGYGHIGVQVLISKGEILPPRREEPTAVEPAEEEEAPAEETVAEAAAETPAETPVDTAAAQVEEPSAVDVAEDPLVEMLTTDSAAGDAPETADAAVEEVTEEESGAEEDTGDVDA
ncbi:MAG: 30S ribosomal protein S3, partial [Armatimonadetes bacterium]|nr:30S ribosomal protein S3 [Armatimonadota bacterium]